MVLQAFDSLLSEVEMYACIRGSAITLGPALAPPSPSVGAVCIHVCASLHYGAWGGGRFDCVLNPWQLVVALAPTRTALRDHGLPCPSSRGPAPPLLKIVTCPQLRWAPG